jgi:hypothetical protein
LAKSPPEAVIADAAGGPAVASYTELKTVWIELTGATRDPFQLG